MDQERLNKALEQNGLSDLIDKAPGPSYQKWSEQLFMIDCLLMALIHRLDPNEYAEFLNGLYDLLRSAPVRYRIEQEEKAYEDEGES